MTDSPSELLARLCAAARGEGSLADAMIVAAHPDDEVIGASVLLPRLRPRAGVPAILHTTDGAPRDMGDALRAGFTTREDYSAARRRELCDALALAGLNESHIRILPHTDKEASLALVKLTHELADLFRSARPALVVTHPYEGGHPDHDATAFAVRAAARLLALESSYAPVIFEFTSYHAHGDHLRRAAFLAHEDVPADAVCEVMLTPAAQNLKRRMFDRFVSQSSVLANFEIERERFRIAPRYDFTRAPHAGGLHYETFDWGWTGARWRTLAASALGELDLTEPHDAN